MLLKDILITMRPNQWTKNFLLFAGLIFSGKMTNLPDVLVSVQAFIVFCLGSSSIYILNDIIDRENDRGHPQKRLRPIAAGQITVPVALSLAGSLLIFSIVLSIRYLNVALIDTFFTYLLLMACYIFVLRRVVILDLIVVAVGFVLRAIAGAVVLKVAISPWLMICTFFLALLVLMGKRRHEILLLGKEAYAHRSILKEYSLGFIDQLIAVVTSSAVISYSLYTFSEDTVARLGTNLMPLTIPFVLYGIFRYLYLTHQQNQGGAPEELFVNDKALLVNGFLWVAAAVAILYFT
ncbi:MAG: hypothetical protein A2Z88_06480 [Omnitrophica WOR_2 bacterium GWA2_47_8]|nr:MAG: hypothetical protein A2Z88_06480 [Omnitrophica WOR_2 bacterium GWA2_47_8]